MNKIFFALLVSVNILLADFVNGIAIVVNGDPVTLYDINQTMNKNGISKSKAVELLIDDVLYDQLIKKNNIKADIFDVDDYVQKLANRNNMDIFNFKKIIEQKYGNYNIFEEEVKKEIVRSKLLKEITRGKIKIASKEDIESYYNKNKNKFTVAKSYKITEYSSVKKNYLVNIINNPMLMLKDVKVKELNLENNKISQQLRYILNNVKENSFTPIFAKKGTYVTLFINKKNGKSILSLENVKTQIFNEIMVKREKKFLKEYFEKRKITADIKIIR